MVLTLSEGCNSTAAYCFTGLSRALERAIGLKAALRCIKRSTMYMLGRGAIWGEVKVMVSYRGPEIYEGPYHNGEPDHDIDNLPFGLVDITTRMILYADVSNYAKLEGQGT